MTQLHYNNFRFEHKKSESPDKTNFLNHMHNEWELYYFIEGDVDYVINGSIYHLQPHDLLFIKPAVYHCAKPNANKIYERIVIDFPTQMIPKHLREQLDNVPTLLHLPINSPIRQLLIYTSAAVNDYSRTDAIFTVENSLNLLLLQLTYLSNSLSHKQTEAPLVNTLFAQIIQYIDDNIEDALDLESIARYFFISQSWITHSFKRYINTSAKQYINHKKILLAQTLIKSGTPPSEAALKLSFNDYSTFYRLYKKYLGVTPEKDKKSRLSST